MSLRKGWHVISILIGIATLIVLWCVYSLSALLHYRNNQAMIAISPPMTAVHTLLTMDSTGLLIKIFIALMLMCGVMAVLLSRPAGVSLRKCLCAPLLAASLPVIVIDLLILVSYYGSTQEFYSGHYDSGPLYPTEPPFLPFYLLIIALVTLSSLILSAIGGAVACWILNSRNDL